MDTLEIISSGLETLGLSGRVPAQSPELLDRYLRLLLEKNQVMNLTAIREPEAAARLHMLDCAALLNYCDLEGKTLIDVGTGAGFPGMVLKMLAPSLNVTLLDSLNKRLDWLQEVCGELGLQGIRILHARAEEQAHVPDFRDGFDFAAARAVAELRALCELCLPFVKVGGLFLAMKSVDSDDELDRASHAIKLLGGRVRKVQDYAIPGADVVHRLVVIEKAALTPGEYPRRWAKMQKSPL